MKNCISDQRLALNADRVLVMAWICTLADKVKALTRSGSSLNEIESVCDEIVGAGIEMISDLYADAADCGITVNEIREFTIIGAKNVSRDQRERLLEICECRA